MHEITAEGTRFYYFVPGEAEAGPIDLPLEARLPDPALVIWLESEGSRLALFPSLLNPRRGIFYFLYWPGETDLSASDRRVLDGTYTDADFAPAMRTVFQRTFCDSCHRDWPTLVIPPGDPYPGAPGLMDRKIRAARLERCPGCNAYFRQMVVKILKE